jgi:hypothetical protein
MHEMRGNGFSKGTFPSSFPHKSVLHSVFPTHFPFSVSRQRMLALQLAEFLVKYDQETIRLQDMKKAATQEVSSLSPIRRSSFP